MGIVQCHEKIRYPECVGMDSLPSQNGPYSAYRHWTNPGEPTEGTAPSYMMARRLHINVRKPVVRQRAPEEHRTRAQLLLAQRGVDTKPAIKVEPEWQWAAELRAAIQVIKESQMVSVSRDRGASEFEVRSICVD